MVDAVVSFAVQNLGNFLIEEVALRRSLRENVQWLRNELLFMQSFLKDAEQKQAEDQSVQHWIFEITSVANDAVAILETYNLDDGSACACICRKETKFYNIGKEIQLLKQRIMDISRKRETYGITDINNAGEGPSNQSAMVRTLRRSTSYVDDQDHIFVGFKDVVETLLAELLKAEPRLSVISIYGMGGLGKTTLARNLYNSASAISSFQTRSWICVSQEYSIPDLLRSIIKSIQGITMETLDFLEKMTGQDLESYLRDLLKNGKYLLVVDDVWHREAWKSLKRAFPDNKDGSRVIITTRKEEVAEQVDNKGFVHKLRFLSQGESWDLFWGRLRRENNFDGIRQWSPVMEELAWEMLKKCGGLPLAVVVLAGLLSHKKGLEDWQKVKAHIWQHMQHNTFEISHILSLSYNDLSSELKQCFLYFGMFPEDHVINTEKLSWLWIAEGLIPPRGKARMEEVAENFLNELISRSLILVAETFWEKVAGCRIHDLLRDLAVQKAMEVNLFDIYDTRVQSIHPLRHRHAIHTGAQKYLSLDLSVSKVRSLLFFDREEDMEIKKLMCFCNMFQHLYVLELESIYFDDSTLPHDIGNLVHLKFLGLAGTNIQELPPTIGKLKNLQTLLIPEYRSCSVPPQIAKLTNLRHLVGRFGESPLHVGKLTDLQTLKYIGYHQWKCVDVVGLVNLQELVVESIRKSYSLNTIRSKKSLSTLMLCCESGETFPPLEPLSSCQNLHRLWLSGRIEKLPLSDQFPKSITVIVLRYSKLPKDPMPILGMLSNLRNLGLLSAYDGKDITCPDDSFGQLEYLRLCDLENLERWHLAASAMPLIRGLGIHDCLKLHQIPNRMKNITILEKLNRQDWNPHHRRFPVP